MTIPMSSPLRAGPDIKTAPPPLLRIALPNKGRLAQDTRDLFNDAGLEVRALSDRALKASLGGEFEAIFVRAQDIPEFVSDGAADAGVTGMDLISESGRDITSRLDLAFEERPLATEVGLSVSQLNRLFVRQFGFSSLGYFERRRKEQALAALQGSAHTIKEIAFELGFSSLSHFSAWVTQQFGMAPSLVRERTRDALHP